MKNNPLTLAKCLQLASLPALVLAICIPDTGAAQAVHQAAGTWNITVSGSYQFELQLRQSGQTIEGTMRRTNGTEPIDAVSGTVGTDGSVTFTRTRAPNEWRQTYTGNIKAQGGTLHMNGDWAHNGNPMGAWHAEQTGRIGLVGAGKRQSTVMAIIDKKCIPRDAPFTVPAGQTATNFRFAGLSSGTNCTTGGRVANPAWGISSGGETRTGNAFYYNQNDNGTIHEITNGLPGRLADLVLGPGQYAVHVDGGIDAHVSVTFDLVAAIPGGGGVAGGGGGLVGAGNRQSTVRAIIDKKCIPRDAPFTVPAGQTATSFRFAGLSSGTHCTTGGRVANPAWGISSGGETRTGNAFYYNQNDNGTVHEITNGMPGRLADLVLGPGQYAVHVDGGIDAHVSVTFVLVAAIPGGGGVAGGGGPAGTPPAADGELIRQSGTQPIYVIEKGIRRWIPDMETFNARGYSLGAVKDISFQEIRSVPVGQPISSVKSGGASTADKPAPGGTFLPQPGIYRGDGDAGSWRLTDVTSTSISIAWWDTNVNYPPSPKTSKYFGRGTLTPLGGGLWRMRGKDQPGFSGVMEVEGEFRVLSPTSVVQVRWRWWKIGTARPPNDQAWQDTGYHVRNLVQK